MTNRVKSAVDVLDTLREYGGACVVLIHPDVLEDKLEFLKAFVSEAKARDVWFGTLGDFGKWWTVRDGVNMEVRRHERGIEVRLHLGEAVSGFALQVPEGWRLSQESLGNPAFAQHGRQVIVNHGAGSVRLSFLDRS